MTSPATAGSASAPSSHDEARLQRRALFALLALAAPQVALAWLGSREPLTLLLSTAAVAVAVWCYLNSFAGLVIILLFQMRVLQSTEAIGVDEIAYAGLFVVTVLGWAVRRANTDAGRAALSSTTGRSILLFFGIAAASLVPAVLYGHGVLWWFRDLVRYSPLLLFFPIATECVSNRRSAIMGAAFLAVVLFFGVYAVKTYQDMLGAATFAADMQWQRAPINELLPMVLLIVSSALFFRPGRRAHAFWALIIGLVSAIALAVSLSRGFWAAAVIGVTATALVSRVRPSRVFGFAVALGVVGLAGAYAVFGWRLTGVLMSLGARFSTLSSPLADWSVQERLVEARELLKLIARNPVIGQGLGATIRFMSPVKNYLHETTFSHNAWLFLLFKVGVVGLAAYVAFLIRGFTMVREGARRAADAWTRAAMTGGLGVLAAFLMLSVTSPPFHTKSGSLVLAILFGLAQASAMRRAGAAGADETAPAGGGQ